MAIVINSVLTFDDAKIPVEGTPEFRENASYVWSQINPVLKSLNVSIEQINVAYPYIEQYRNESEQFRDESLIYRNDALLAKDVIEKYVIPEEATLSEEEINELFTNIDGGEY
jgi:hypothetical protein